MGGRVDGDEESLPSSVETTRDERKQVFNQSSSLNTI